MSPLAQSDGHNAPRLIDEAIPSVAAVIDDIVVRAEDAVGQPVVSHELPEYPSGLSDLADLLNPEKLPSR